MGISMCWPILLAEASRRADVSRARPALVVGGMTAMGYLGFLIGPAVVGVVAGRVGLETGIVILAAVALVAVAAPLIAMGGPPLSGGASSDADRRSGATGRLRPPDPPPC
jgi:MFS family permease